MLSFFVRRRLFGLAKQSFFHTLKKELPILFIANRVCRIISEALPFRMLQLGKLVGGITADEG
jgi:hypothetical protein